MSKTTRTTAGTTLRTKSKPTTELAASKSKATALTKTKSSNVPTKPAPKATKDTEIQVKPKILTKSQSIETATPKVTTKPPATKAKTQTTTKTTTAKSSTSAAVQKPTTKRTTVAGKPNEKATQPLRAKHSAAIVEQVRNNAANLNANKSPAKPNAVLDTYHNVTVASPPPRRRELPESKKDEKSMLTKEVASSKAVARPGTRTLDAEEVIVLKSESAKQRSEQQVNDTVAELLQPKEPIAFEVNFADKRERSRSRSRPNEKVNAGTTQEAEGAEYSDDFESYESDFETGSGTPSSTTTDAETEDTSSESDTGTESSESASERDAKSTQLDSDEDTELTQFPVTVIQPDKELDRKLDSGNYEMNSRRQTKLTELTPQTSQQQITFDSMDTTITSEQLDSGISSYEQSNALLRLDADAVVYGGYADFNTRPIRSQRGLELMSKIQFDTITYTLLDFKPISYDVFMQTYGKLNTTQSSTQTNDRRISMECQTEDCDVRSMWTQHPPQYDLQTVQRLGGSLGVSATMQNCCGELPQIEMITSATTSKPVDELDASLQAMGVFRERECTRTVTRQLQRLRKPIDFERLNAFLLNSSLLMSRVLNSNGSNREQQYHPTAGSSQFALVSSGYRQFGTHFLTALRVVRIFANAKFNLVITVHESLYEADVYRSDFSNLLMVWSTNDTVKPIRLLSSWSEVCRAEVCNDSSDIIVCGLRDGSVAMWDLRETYSFCSKLDGHLTHFAATQSIVPVWHDAGNDSGTRTTSDLGAVVDVKSFRSMPRNIGLEVIASGYKSIQFTSLNDTGILTVWTLVDVARNKTDNFFSHAAASNFKRSPNVGAKFEYSSPWARIKLIQSAICDLRNYLEQGILRSQSKFELTKSNFQKNIYNDVVLRELNETQTEFQQGNCLQGLRFTSIDTGCERIYICTNRNFILICSKSLKSERFRKITINESRYLFPTAIRVLSNENFLAVGLSNGSVIILNCEQNHSAILAAETVAAPQSPNGLHNAVNPPINDYDLQTGKSCAIQNIILNERRSFEETSDFMQNFSAPRPSTAVACIAMLQENKKPFELRVYDQQILLSGSVLRKHLVQSLELSSDGWKLFALADGEVRTYDFFLDCELTQDSGVNDAQRVLDIAVARDAAHEQFLVSLNDKGEVQLHLLKK